jgi:hypothetical protein
LLEIPISQKRTGLELSPNLEIDIPGSDKIRCLTKVIYIPGKKLDWDTKIRNFPWFKSPAKSTGSIVMVNNNKKHKYEVKIDLSAAELKTGIQGYLDMDPDTVDLTSRLSLDYAMGSSKHRFILNNKVKDKSTNSIMQYAADSQWSASTWPAYSGDASVDVSIGQKSLEFNLDTGFDEKRRIRIKESGSIDLDGLEKKVNGKLELAIPMLDLDYKATLDHKHSSQNLETDAKVSYAPAKDVALNMKFSKENSELLDGTSDITLSWPGRCHLLIKSLASATASRISSSSLQPQ